MERLGELGISEKGEKEIMSKKSDRKRERERERVKKTDRKRE